MGEGKYKTELRIGAEENLGKTMPKAEECRRQDYTPRTARTQQGAMGKERWRESGGGCEIERQTSMRWPTSSMT
jgi:hypothetical protein